MAGLVACLLVRPVVNIKIPVLVSLVILFYDMYTF